MAEFAEIYGGTAQSERNQNLCMGRHQASIGILRPPGFTSQIPFIPIDRKSSLMMPPFQESMNENERNAVASNATGAQMLNN